MKNNKQSFIPGMILIAIGLLLLSPKIGRGFDPWEHALPLIIILFSLVLLLETFRKHNSNALFWGVVLILTGSFYSLRNFNVIPYFYIDEYWPVFLIFPGLGILVQNLIYNKRTGSFVSAAILIFLGSFCLLFTLPYDFNNIEYYLSKFWPLIFIIIGVLFIAGGIKSFNRKEDEELEKE